MKALYEEVGKDFEFGIKYSYTITGEINYDFANRESTDEQKFLNQYTMELSVLIDIDETDLIDVIVRVAIGKHREWIHNRDIDN